MIKQTVMMLSSILLAGSAFAAAASGCDCPSTVTPDQLKEMSESKKVRIGSCEFEAESTADLKKVLAVMQKGIQRGEFEKRVSFNHETPKTNGKKCTFSYKKRFGSAFGSTPFTIMYTNPGVAHKQSSAEISHAPAARPVHSAPAALGPQGAPPVAPRVRPAAPSAAPAPHAGYNPH